MEGGGETQNKPVRRTGTVEGGCFQYNYIVHSKKIKSKLSNYELKILWNLMTVEG